MSAIPFGLQLYTVRDHMEKDPEATLKAVKAAGYDNVELAGTAGMSAADYRALLDDCGLRAFSGHVGIEELVEDVDQTIEDAHILGMDYVVVPFIGGDMTPNREAWVQYAREMEAAGFTLKEAGLTLCYHNHAHEYEILDGETALDAIFNTADAEALAAELDVYWIRHAGFDPVAEIEKRPGRLPILHVKDMTDGDPPTFAEVGKGVIDWEPVFRAAEAAGVKWYAVEQDTCPVDSLESARVSAEYMKQL